MHMYGFYVYIYIYRDLKIISDWTFNRISLSSRCVSKQGFEHWQHHSYNSLYDHPGFEPGNMHDTDFNKHSPLDHFPNRARSGGTAAAGMTKQTLQPLLVIWYILSILEHISLRKTRCLYQHSTSPAFYFILKTGHLQCKPRQPWTTNPALDNWSHIFGKTTDAAPSVVKAAVCSHTPGQRLLQQHLQTQLKPRKQTRQKHKSKDTQMCQAQEYLSFLSCFRALWKMSLWLPHCLLVFKKSAIPKTYFYFEWSPPWHSYLAFYLAFLSDILSGILSGIQYLAFLSDILSGILIWHSDLAFSSGILSGIPSGILIWHSYLAFSQQNLNKHMERKIHINFYKRLVVVQITSRSELQGWHLVERHVTLLTNLIHQHEPPWVMLPHLSQQVHHEGSIWSVCGEVLRINLTNCCSEKKAQWTQIFDFHQKEPENGSNR